MIDWLADNAGATGLLFFFGTFLLIFVWAFIPKAKQQIESYKNIPLAEDDA